MSPCPTIRSRFGNLLLGSVGALCLLSSIALIAALLYTTSFDEILLEMLLVACSGASVWFLTTSAKNLQIHGH